MTIHPRSREYREKHTVAVVVVVADIHPLSLAELSTQLRSGGPVKLNPTSRRVRVRFNDTYIIDTTKAVHVWEHAYYPQFYVPISELRNCAWKDKGSVDEPDSLSATIEITVASPDGATRTTDRAIRFFDQFPHGLGGLVKLEFHSMDQWFEEDVPIYVHPKDPFKRIDILQSSRPIEIRVSGQTVAKSTYSVHLLETGLPTRYYLPLTAVEPSVLRASELNTQCPYKGEASYYHVKVGDEESKDIVWYYRQPLIECAGIANLVCFYNEKVDIILEGQLLDRPKTPFS